MVVTFRNIMMIFVLFVCLVMFNSTGFAETYSVILQWDSNTEPDLAGYKVYYQAEASTLTFMEGVVPIDTSLTTYTLSGLDRGFTYYFAVTSYNSSLIESDYSNIVTVLEDVPPGVTSFLADGLATSLAIPISTFVASDNTGGSGVASYCVTTTNTSSGCSWESVIPASYTVSTAGTYTLYPWVKDKAGNISSLYSTPVEVKVVLELNPPVVNIFTIPAYSNALNFSVTFAASDEVGGSGLADFCITTSNSSTGCSWNSTNPTSYTVATEGSYTIYPWARDRGGNISAVFGTPQTVVVDTTSPAISFSPTTSPTILTSQTLTGTVSDNLPGVTVTVQVGATAPVLATITGPDWVYPVTSLAVGSNTIIVTATDVAGNMAAAPASMITYFYPGAVNTDGTITVNDALKLLNFVLGLDTPTAEQFIRSDVAPIDMTTHQPKPDGKLDIDDVIVMLRRAVGLPW